MTITDTDADRALKAKHRKVWASGDYPTLAHDLIWTLGPVLVDAGNIHSGQLVLDVAAGSGNVAIPAAERGANVVASDLTPELFDAGRRAAAERGVEIDWREADAEALPFPDGAFDAVLSCVGVMFAPHHQASADELVRVAASRRDAGSAELDAAGVHRSAVRDHEAVQPAAARGRPASAAVGRRGARTRAARRSRHRCLRRASHGHRDAVPRRIGPQGVLRVSLRTHDGDVRLQRRRRGSRRGAGRRRSTHWLPGSPMTA